MPQSFSIAATDVERLVSMMIAGGFYGLLLPHPRAPSPDWNLRKPHNRLLRTVLPQMHDNNPLYIKIADRVKENV